MLCDVGLPDLSGYQIVRHVHRRDRGVAPFIVALTGYARPEDIERARNAGFDAHLSKPLAVDKLRELLGSVAARARRPEPPRGGEARA